MVKIVFEAGGQVQFEVNLKETLDCVNTPWFKKSIIFDLNLTTAI